MYVSPRTTRIKAEQREKGREEREREMQSAKTQVRDRHPFENKADINTKQPQTATPESRQESLQGHKGSWTSRRRG